MPQSLPLLQKVQERPKGITAIPDTENLALDRSIRQGPPFQGACLQRKARVVVRNHSAKAKKLGPFQSARQPHLILDGLEYRAVLLRHGHNKGDEQLDVLQRRQVSGRTRLAVRHLCGCGHGLSEDVEARREAELVVFPDVVQGEVTGC